VNEAMAAEFDTVAAWTSEVALDLGREYFLPAACRGSASPGALRWLLQHLGPTDRTRMLDCGAGVGGPAAFASAEVGVTPVLSEPEAGACRGARRLFGLPVVQAASDLPFASNVFDVIWSLGVLCTIADQSAFLAELRRVLTPDGLLGLLVFVARTSPLPDEPSGNNFPTEDELRQLLSAAGFTVINSAASADFAEAPAYWREHAEAVESELERRHHDHPAWRTAARQSKIIGRLLGEGDLTGVLMVAGS
jgi:SAM-dependent methyltransferase